MRKFALIFAALVIATLLFRLPALLNARDLNSDAAVVGLQAMHMLHGEWSWFLWGAGYQSSVDSAITAVAFAIFGSSPTVLMLVPIFGHLIVIFLALLILRKRVGLTLATICVLPLVITPWAITSVVIYPPRQWCVTLVFVGVWLLDGAAESRRPMLRYALGAACAISAIYVDLFGLLFLPGMIVLALICALDGAPDQKLRNRRIIACAIGCLIGFIPIGLSRLSQQSASSPARLDLSRISFNAQLLWQQCLPFSLGYALYKDSALPIERGLWTAPMPWYALQVLAGWSLVMFIASGGISGLMNRNSYHGRFARAGESETSDHSEFERTTHGRDARDTWELRRLGIFGFSVAMSVPLLFLLSAQPYDMWAVRYLGPIFWMAPFAIAPLAARWGVKKFVLAISPYLIVAAVGGWLSYGFWVNGPLPHDHASASVAETDELCQFLRDRGIKAAFTDFWLSYRLTFLDHENPIFAPLDHDRYAPYRALANNQPIRVYVFHPTWSRTPTEEETEQNLRQQNIEFESAHVGRFTVLLASAGKPVSRPSQ